MADPLTKSQTSNPTAEILPSTSRLIEPKGPCTGTQSPSSLLSRATQRAPKKKRNKKKEKTLNQKEAEGRKARTHREEEEGLSGKSLRRARASIPTGFWVSMELQNTVKEALNALYHHPDDAFRMQADRWLQDFQRTLDAWQVSISIAFWVFDFSCSIAESD